MSRGGIGSLPIELLGHIFSWIDDDHDLISISSVCRLWYDVVNQYLLQRTRAAILRPEATHFKPIPPLQRLSLIEFDDEQFDNVKDLFIDLNRLHIGFEGPADRSIGVTALSGLLDACKNLETLSFRNVAINDKVIDVITRKTVNTLDSLTFECTSLLTDNVNEILEKVLFLEFKLVLRPSCSEANAYANYPFPYDTVNCIEIPKYITKLQMDCRGLSKNSYSCLKYCNNLQCLELLCAYNLEDDAITSCFTRLPELKKISFSDANKVTIDGWKSLFNRAELTSVTLVRCCSGLSDVVFQDAKAARCFLDLDLQNCKRVTGEGLIFAILLTERLSLTFDYNEELVERLENFVTLGKSPRLRCLHIAIQRLHATSSVVSRHLNKFKRNLSFYSRQNDINFTFKELLTRAERNYQPVISINFTNENT